MGVTKGPSRATLARRKNAKERRTRVLAEGGRRVDVLLTREPADVLDELEASSGENATSVISGLLLLAKKSRR